MTRRLAQLTLFILLLAAPAYADEVVIDFNSGSFISTIPPIYTESGFNFAGGSYSNGVITINSYHISQPSTIRIDWMHGGAFDLLDMDIVYWAGAGTRTILRASNGVEMDLSIALNRGFIDFTNITWLEWVHYGQNVADRDDWGPNPIDVDSFRFNTGTVPTPEPATLLLLGSGLLGVLGAARKRRSS